MAAATAVTVNGAEAVRCGSQVKRVTTQARSAVTVSKTLRAAEAAAPGHRVEDRMRER